MACQKSRKDKVYKHKQASNEDFDIRQMLESSEWEFKTIINMLRAVMEKVDNMQKQMGNVNGDIEIQTKE